MGAGGIAGVKRDRRRGSLLADPARLELLNIGALRDLLVREPQPSSDPIAITALDHAVIGRELYRRTGDSERLSQARTAAARAARAAGAERRLYGGAKLQSALCALAASEVSGDPEGSTDAETALGEAEAALGCAPGRLGGPGLIRARLAARAALARLDVDAVLDASALFEEAATALEARMRVTGAGETEWAAALCERAELAIGLGSARKDIGPLDRAARDMGLLASRLDAVRLPLSWMRAQTLQGSAWRALGEVTGEARLMMDAAVALGGAYDAIPAGHSPLDRARAAHALGLALQGLAEATGDAMAFRSAQAALDRALSEMGAAQTPLCSVIAYDRAAALARRAERTGDSAALAQAEAAFRADLAGRAANDDPVGWAVVQMALARIYQARADLQGDKGERADAAFALTEAVEVFTEHGQRTLTGIALAALDRAKGGKA